jgi:rhomboid protease GluP
MVKFEEEFFSLLVNKFQFYINEYYSKSVKVNKWISILEKENYIYSIIVAKEGEENIVHTEAMNYLRGKFNKPIIINVIVAIEGINYNISNVEIKNTLVYSLNEERVIYSDEGCKSLLPIFNYMSKVKNTKDDRINKSIITYSLIIINIIIFIITMIISQSIYNINIYTLIMMGAKFNQLIDQGQVWRLITATFLHGGLLHLVLNMYALKIIGSEVEYVYGKIKYIIIYVCSALGGSIFSYFFNGDSISVGASGAIFGLFGAMLIFGFTNRAKIGKAYMMNILKVIGVNILLGVTISSIDNAGHLGGLLVGAIVAIICSLTIGGKGNELKEE